MHKAVNGSKNGEKTISVDFIRFYLGKAYDFIQLLNQSFPELGLTLKDCHEMSWIESRVLWADFPSGTSIDVLLDRPIQTQFFSKNKSDYAKKVIPKEGLKKIWKKMIDVWSTYMEWNPHGGRMSEIFESETPFPYRAGSLYKIQYVVLWEQKGIEVSQRYINRLRDLHALTASYVSNGPRAAFINYRDLDTGNSNEASFRDAKIYGEKYFKGNF